MVNPTVPTRKPKRQQTTMKTLADWGNRSLPPESELKLYEFANGTVTKKAGKGAYSNN